MSWVDPLVGGEVVSRGSILDRSPILRRLFEDLDASEHNFGRGSVISLVQSQYKFSSWVLTGECLTPRHQASIEYG